MERRLIIRKMKLQIQKAVEYINKQGCLIVFPVNNNKEPLSLWSQFFPKSKMRWEWNEDSDDRIGQLWMLMKSLSAQDDVVYSKWFKGRATFFSRELFVALLKSMETPHLQTQEMPRKAASILETLQSNSPMSTRDIKKEHGLQGKDNEAEFNRCMKYLFSRLLIVGRGEVEDGAFPSLAVGATSLIFEDLWLSSKKISIKNAHEAISHFMPEKSLTLKFLNSIKGK